MFVDGVKRFSRGANDASGDNSFCLGSSAWSSGEVGEKTLLKTAVIKSFTWCLRFFKDNDQEADDVLGKSHHALDGGDLIGLDCEDGVDVIAVSHLLHFVKPGDGDLFLGQLDVSTRFLMYSSTLSSHFIDSFFVDVSRTM